MGSEELASLLSPELQNCLLENRVQNVATRLLLLEQLCVGFDHFLLNRHMNSRQLRGAFGALYDRTGNSARAGDPPGEHVCLRACTMHPTQAYITIHSCRNRVARDGFGFRQPDLDAV